MNFRAEAQVDLMLDQMPDCYPDPLRTAMRWAYRDAAKVMSNALHSHIKDQGVIDAVIGEIEKENFTC